MIKKANPLFYTQKSIIPHFVHRHIKAASDYRTNSTQILKTMAPLQREFVP